MCRCAVRSSGEPMRWARSHSPSGGSITYSERSGLNPTAHVASPRRRSSAASRSTSAPSAATAASTESWMRVRTSRPLGSQRTQLACVVEALVALDVPALALDALVADAQVGVVGRVLGQGVDHGLQLVEREVGEVGERSRPRAGSRARARCRTGSARPGAWEASLAPGTRFGRSPDPLRPAPPVPPRPPAARRCTAASTGGSATKTSPGSFSGPEARSTTASNSAPTRGGQQRGLGAVHAGPAPPCPPPRRTPPSPTGRVGSAAVSHSGNAAPAATARQTSVPNRSTSRRSGAVTCAYGAPIPPCPGSAGGAVPAARSNAA